MSKAEAIEWPDRERVTLWQLKEERNRARVGDEQFAGHGSYTCDECWHAQQCALAFDGYNTNGDCLADK